jgi:hypothetical protein
VNFSVPPGWRAWLVEHLLGRELERGPEEALAGLKRLAEAHTQDDRWCVYAVAAGEPVSHTRFKPSISIVR